MAEPYIGEIRIFAFNYAPEGWALCNGATMYVQQNQALFAIISTLYGGQFPTTFQLPNLQGQVVAGWGGASQFNGPGTKAGTASVTLNPATLAAHSHGFTGMTSSNKADYVASPANQAYIGQGFNFINKTPGKLESFATLTSPLTSFGGSGLPPVGGNQPHENRQPYLGMNYCIALQGIYPIRQ